MPVQKSSKSQPATQEHDEQAGRTKTPPRPVVINDPLVPHTHTAQKMKPYEGAAPSYVNWMDDYAIAAGLTVRRLVKRSPTYGDEALLVYSGTREQIMRCELLVNADKICWPTRNKASSATAITIAPMRYALHCNVHRLREALYAITFKVDLPRVITTPSKGIECFDFRYREDDCSHVAYCGTKPALVEAGIAEADMFPDEGDGMEITAQDAMGYDCKLEESTRLHNGLWAYLKHPREAKRIKDSERAESERNLSDYATPEAWLEFKEDWICDAARIMLGNEKFFSVENKNGLRYTISNPAELASILNDIEAAAQRIRDVSVKVQPIERKATPAERGKAAAAETDGKFQSFMKSVVSSPRRGNK